MGDTGKGLVGRFRDLIGDVDGDGVNEGLGEGRAGSQKPTPAPAATAGGGATDESGIINPFDPGAEEKIKAQTPRPPRRPKPEEADDEPAATVSAPAAPPTEATVAATNADDGFSFDDLGRISLSGVGEFLEETRRDIEDRAFPDLTNDNGQLDIEFENSFDVDRDGRADHFDEDVDNDGVLNAFDVDDDGDGVHDLFDPDDDGDNLRDRTEAAFVAPHRDSTGRLRSDTNLTNADDSVEPLPPRAPGVKAAATEVVDPISRGFFGLGDEEFLPVEQLENDLDGDGTIDEVDLDADGDGFDDIADPDDDNDLITDPNDTDADGDGFLDRSEQRIRESAAAKGASADPAPPTDVAAEPEAQLAEAPPTAPPAAPLVDEDDEGDDFGTGAAVAAVADQAPTAAEAAESADNGGSFLTDAIDALADVGRSAVDALSSTFGFEADDTADVAAVEAAEEPVDEPVDEVA